MGQIIAFIALLIAQSLAADDLLVEIANGKVQGTTLTSPDGTTFYTWRHIPYAKPPLNELRFMFPVRPDKWSEVLDGSQDPPACMFVGTLAGDPEPTNGHSEDCLYVNVYSPVPANSSLTLPVIFWIYGGGFKVGTGDFSFTDPTPLLEDGVIVVTFNYRLDIFGFVSTGDEVLPGNGGLKDQFAALMWTRENINFFGGDPFNIILLGESAGARSVGYFLVSSITKDLFNGAIMQSGCALLSELQMDPRGNAVKIARQVNSTITNDSSSESIVQVLQAVNAELLVNLSLAATGHILFHPVMEVYNQNNLLAFISRPIYEEIAVGNVTRVPIIIGTNSEELIGLISDLQEAETLAALYDSNLHLLLPDMPLKDGTNVTDVIQDIKEAYAGNGTFQEQPGSIIRFLSDNNFVRPALKHASLHSQFSAVYFYEFSFAGTPSAARPTIPGCGRVAHADEVGYIFNVSTKPLATEQDYLTRRRVVKLWTNFAKTKNPTPEDDSAELLQNVTWETLDPDHLQYLDIGENLELKTEREAELTAFWDQLWEAYSFHPYNTF